MDGFCLDYKSAFEGDIVLNTGRGSQTPTNASQRAATYPGQRGLKMPDANLGKINGPVSLDMARR